MLQQLTRPQAPAAKTARRGAAPRVPNAEALRALLGPAEALLGIVRQGLMVEEFTPACIHVWPLKAGVAAAEVKAARARPDKPSTQALPASAVVHTDGSGSGAAAAATAGLRMRLIAKPATWCEAAREGGCTQEAVAWLDDALGARPSRLEGALRDPFLPCCKFDAAAMPMTPPCQ